MIVLVDQLLWRPALAWAQRFKIEEAGAVEVPRSAVLDLLRRSRVIALARRTVRRRLQALRAGRESGRGEELGTGEWVRRLGVGGFAVGALLVTAWGGVELVLLLRQVPAREWAILAGCLALTTVRTASALLLGAAWTVPVGVWIGLSPARTRLLQPAIQIAASFPAPMIFPLVTATLLVLGVPFSWGCVVLMLLGSQWYILFNVLAGATAMPQDMREAADVYGLGGWMRWRTLYLPAVFPHLVTGLITAAGGAWNASIVSEYVRFQGRTLVAPGLGSLITQASESANFPLLAAGVTTMSLALVGLNRTVWRRLYRLADERYSLNR